MPQHSLWAISLTILLPIFGYLLGSISAAIVVARLLRLPDPRQAGSGNPGATNVLRLGGKRAAALTLAGDLVKGVVPVALARFLGLEGWALAALGAALAAPFLGFVLNPQRGEQALVIALALLILWRHRSNIARLRSGAERPFRRS